MTITPLLAASWAICPPFSLGNIASVCPGVSGTNSRAAIGICSRVQRESYGISRRTDWSIRYSLAANVLASLGARVTPGSNVGIMSAADSGLTTDALYCVALNFSTSKGVIKDDQVGKAYSRCICRSAVPIYFCKFWMRQNRSQDDCSASTSGEHTDGDSDRCAASGRICGNSEVSSFGEYPAAGRRFIDEDTGEVRRSRARRTSIDDD